MIRKWMISALIVTLMLFVSACGGGAKEPAPASEPQDAQPAQVEEQESASEEEAEPAAEESSNDSEATDEETASESETTDEETDSTGGETASATELEEPIAIEANKGLDELDSYRVRMIFAMDGANAEGEDQSGTVDMTIEAINATNEQHVKFSASGPTFESEGMTSFDAEMFNVNEESYILATMPGAEEAQCISVPGQAGQEIPIEPSELIEGLESSELLKKGETVNGILSDHYVIDENSEGFGEIQEIQDATGDIWIAQDGGYLVKFDAEVTGEDSSGLNGTFRSMRQCDRPKRTHA